MTKMPLEVQNMPETNLENFIVEIEDYSRLFLESRTNMQLFKDTNWSISLEKLTEIFAEYVSKKEDIIKMFMNPDNKENIDELKNYLKERFNILKWPEKRAIWEIIAWIENNLYLNLV